MSRILVILTHPDLAHSRINASWDSALRAESDITLHDLQATYQDDVIDGEAERWRLLEHDLIVLQFPLTWYSCPPLLSLWQGAILTRG